eukprot:15477274-Alexandrium_andersonii.AAC.1
MATGLRGNVVAQFLEQAVIHERAATNQRENVAAEFLEPVAAHERVATDRWEYLTAHRGRARASRASVVAWTSWPSI